MNSKTLTPRLASFKETFVFCMKLFAVMHIFSKQIFWNCIFVCIFCMTYVCLLVERLLAILLIWHFLSLAYADDVVLLSPTVDALENMLKICKKYSVDFSIKFNTSKPKLLVFNENSTDVKVNFQGNTIPKVKSETHVGHLMSNSPHIQERRVSQACKTLIGQFNPLSVKLWVLFT